MLRRVLQLGLDIKWLRILPLVACTVIAAALPVGSGRPRLSRRGARPAGFWSYDRLGE